MAYFLLFLSLMSDASPYSFFVSAAETSGDHHAAGLIGELTHDRHDSHFVGLGGQAMAEAGCHLLEDLVQRSAMLEQAVSQVGFYHKLLQRIKAWLAEHRPDLVILVDSPAWNFHVAKAARKLGIPVFYYVAPQLWAWGPWRLGKLRRLVDRVACILPFEQDWFQQRGVDAYYVGHPLFDDPSRVHVEPHDPKTDRFLARYQPFPTVTLLPGSRMQEVEALWPVMLNVARGIRRYYPDARFQTTTASDTIEGVLRHYIPADLSVEINRGAIQDVTRYADLTLVASGTATLEVAAQRCPMLVLYNVHPWKWKLARKWLVSTPFICLVNIIAERELVPEFVSAGHQVSEITQAAMAILEDEPRREELRRDLFEVIAPMLEPGAAVRVAGMVWELLGEPVPQRDTHQPCEPDTHQPCESEAGEGEDEQPEGDDVKGDQAEGEQLEDEQANGEQADNEQADRDSATPEPSDRDHSEAAQADDEPGASDAAEDKPS